MSKDSSQVFIVIAAYNEERKISSVIKGLRAKGYRNVIVVDDCSKDATGALAKRAGAVVLHHKVNQGQGAALRNGINAAVKKGASVIVTFDADGQHRAEEIKRLTAPVLAGKVDVALGSRFLGKAPGIPWYKWITLKGSIFVERIFLGVKLTDVHNGFRCLSADAAKKIRITEDRMGHASEIVYELKLRNLRYVEVPVTIAYDRYTNAKGQSIFNAFCVLRELLRMKRRKRKEQS